MPHDDGSNETFDYSQLPDAEEWAATEPETALRLSDVKPGKRIKTYIPGHTSSMRRYEITPTKEKDTGGDLLISCRDLETGETRVTSPATLGLSLSPGGNRYRWAIPDDTDS